ncbi:porin, partial [Sutterella massiliensis]
FGTLSFGRVGQLMSGLGSYGLMSKFSVFGGGWGDYTGGKFTHAGYWGRMDNTITYVTPEFAGLKGYLQYSFQNDTQDKDLRYGAPTEGKASSDRTLSAAVTANYGNFG